MKSTRSIIIPLLAFLITIGGSIGLQNRMIDRWYKEPRRFRDSLYLPSSEYVRVMSLGYNQFHADFLWLRMIQVFAAAWSSAENPTQIFNYCDKITDLDPRFNDPYCFAIMGISEESRAAAKRAEESKNPNDPFGTPYLKVKQIDQYLKAITDKAVMKNPGDYRVPYDGAFFAYWNMNDLQLAKYYLRMAKHDPDYPNYIDRWEGYFDMKAGRHRAAYEKFLGDYINAIRAGNKDLYAINRMQIYRSMNDWFITEIKQRAQEWKKTHGQWPSVEELRKAGAFKGVELPDVRLINGILRGMLNREIDPNLTPDQINALATKSVHKWDDLPMAPYDVIDPRFQGFTIWRTKDPADEKFISSTLEAVVAVRESFDQIKEDLEETKKATGKYPPLSKYAPALTPEDPFGKPWSYDQASGVLKTPSIPDLGTMKVPGVYVSE